MRLSFRSIFFISTLALTLAGCAAVKKKGPEEAPKAAQPTQTTAKSTPAMDALANLPRVTMQPPERAMRDGLNGPDAPGPERLVGLAAGAIEKMLGTPDFKRRDPPAEVWQYRKDGCLLDVFLYLGEAEYRVTHVEARSHSVTRVSGAECLLEVLAR